MRLRTALLAAAAGSALVTVLAMRAQAQSDSFDPIAEQNAQNAKYHNSVDHPYKPTQYYQATVVPRRTATRHLVYAAEPGGTANGMLPGSGGTGIVVLNADSGYKFVKRIMWDVPAAQMPGPEVSGITASVPTDMVYVGLHGSLVAFDLATDKVAWAFKGEAPGMVKNHYGQGDATGCCERPWTLPDGKTLLVAASYNNWWYLIDATTGALEGKIDTPRSYISHNMAVSPDGKTGYLGSISEQVSIADIPSRKVLRTITFSDAVRPLVINHDGSRVYVNVNNLLGYEVGDSNSGKFLARVEAPAEMWKAKWADPNQHFFGHGGPSHGLGLTPDESELWVADNVNYGVLVYDMNGDSSTLNAEKSFKTPYSIGWITMTNDGKTAFLGDGSVVDVKTHKVTGQLRDEHNEVVATEKLLYMSFQNGRLVETDNQFAEGLPQAVQARLSGNKQASN